MSVKQDEVNTPRVDADTRGNAIQFLALVQPFHHFMKKMIEVPAEVTIALFQFILEAVNLLHADFSLIHPAEDMATARGADIDSQIVRDS